MTDSATKPEFLTVKELADLLRTKERKVYDLAASGQVPCSRATGKLLFPADEMRAWIEGRRTGPTASDARPNVFLGSHDPLLDWALRQSHSGLATFFDSSLDGLSRFVKGEGIATGLHIPDKTENWNTAAVRASAGTSDAVLVRWAARRRGLVVRPEMAERVASVSDLRGLRMARRQDTSGTELLFRQVTTDAGVSPGDMNLTEPCLSESDAVLAVAQRDADVAFGLETIARPFGLRFVPVIEEQFDILVDRRAWFEPPMQTLLAFARTRAFQDRADKLTGYDIRDLGRVQWNA